MAKRSLPENTEQLTKRLRNSQLSALSQSEPTSPPQSRTFRLSGIPSSVKPEQLRTYLNSLICETQRTGENILALSLAPHLDRLVATVTFVEEPLIFRECRPLRSMELPVSTELAESLEADMITDITVDCDFYGITPLYHPPQPPRFE